MKPNKDKTGAWLGALSIVVVLLVAVALGSCTKEPTGLSMPGGDGIEVRVTFPRSEATRAVTRDVEDGTSDENRLDRVAILVFNGDGTKLETVLSEDVTSANTSLSTTQPKWAIDQTLIVSPLVDPHSPKTIYAVANWDKTDFDKATYTEAMLKDELTTIATVADINGNAAFPMLMSGSKRVDKLVSLFYKVPVDMERQASKIRALLTISKEVQAYQTQIEWQTELMKMTVVNVPNKSYVVGRKALPTGTLLKSDPIAVDDTKPAAGDQTPPATKDLEWSESVYITENPVLGTSQAAKDASTYIIVQLPYKNRITGLVDFDNYYKLHINDTRDGTSPYKVLRNTIYVLNIRILGMGLPINNLIPEVNVEDQLTVTDWEKGEIGDVEDTPQYYFNVDHTHLAFQSSETLLKSTIVTNVADWKLIKEDGAIVFSFTEDETEDVTEDVTISGITYTLSGSASVATIAVSRPVDLIDFSTNMFFIAKNLKVPFTVAYDDGK